MKFATLGAHHTSSQITASVQIDVELCHCFSGSSNGNPISNATMKGRPIWDMSW